MKLRGQTDGFLVKSSIQTNWWDLTILEGKKLENAVHDGDNDSESEQVGVGLQQGHLNKESVFKLKLHM